MSASSRTPDPASAYDAFISYSRYDVHFAAQLQRALERYAPPPGLGRAARRLRVFRDQQDFVGTDYFAAIDSQLARSTKLIVICSPAAVASPYVNDEIERFVALHGAANVIPVLIEGRPNNEVAPGHELERAFPEALCRAVTMPLAVAFPGFETGRSRVNGAEYYDAWYTLLANLLDVSRSEIEQRDRRRRQRARRIWGAGISLVFAALAALAAWAIVEGERALARQLTAQAALDSGLASDLTERRVLLAREAARRLDRLGEPATEADNALRAALAQVPRRKLALARAPDVFAFAADGQHLLASSGLRLDALSLVSGRAVHARELQRPLSFLTTSADLRYVAALDAGGAVRVFGWPSLEQATAPPAEVAAAAVDCIAFADDGATLVALRLADTPHAELLRWRVDEGSLVERAAVALPARAKSAAGRPCLFTRKHATTGGFAVMAALESADDDSAASRRTLLYWRLQSLFLSGLFAGARPAAEGAAIRVWPGAVTGELDQNINPVVLLEPELFAGHRIVRRSGLSERTSTLEPTRRSLLGMANGGHWLLYSEGLHDPVVPLLRSVRFDVVDPHTGATMQSMADSGGLAQFTPDAAHVVTVSGRRLRVWDRREGVERLRLVARGEVAGMRFDDASRHVAVATVDGALEVFDIGAADERLRYPGVLSGAALGEHGYALASGRRVLVLATREDARVAELALGGYPSALTASRDGRWLALAVSREPPVIGIGKDPQLVVVETTPELRVRYRGAWAQHRLFDGSSSVLLVLEESGRARLVDLAGGRERWSISIGVPKAAAHMPPGESRSSAAISDDAGTIAVSTSEEIVVLAARDGGVIKRLAQRQAKPVALTGDGQRLAFASGGAITVLRTADGAIEQHLAHDREQAVRALAFSLGGRRLMAISGHAVGTFLGGRFFTHETIRVWDARSGKPTDRVPHSQNAEPTYEASVGARADEREYLTNLAWSADAREIAGVLYASMLAYWSVPSGLVGARIVAWRLTDDGLMETYRARRSDWLQTASLSAGAHALRLSGEHNVQRVVDLTSAHLHATSCAHVRRSFTDDERRAHLGTFSRVVARC